MKIDWKPLSLKFNLLRSAGRRTLALVARGLRRFVHVAPKLARRVWRHRHFRRIRRAAWRLARIGGLAGVLGGLTLFVLLGCLEPVRPGQIGVRARKWGGTGVETEDFRTGLHWSLPGVHGWHFLPAGTRVLNFTFSPSLPGERNVLELRTSDGNPVSVLAAVPWKVAEGNGHRLVAEGLLAGLEGRVCTATEKVLQQELSALSSEELTSPDVRAERLPAIQAALASELAGLFVVPEGIFVHGVYFAPLFEKKLQQKEITRQWSLQAEVGARVEEAKRGVELLEEEIEAAEKRIGAETDRALADVRGEHDSALAAERADAKAYDKRRRADAAAEVARILNEAQAALDQAQAGRIDRLAALRSTPGGRVWLARRAAQQLKLREVVLDASDPRVPSVLDLDAMVGLLMGNGGDAQER